jgi:hypothetical protein
LIDQHVAAVETFAASNTVILALADERAVVLTFSG